MQHARDRIRELTARRRLLSVEWIVEGVNRFLRGWAAYFRYGNSARHFDKIMGYARMRLAIVIARRHRRSRGFGWMVIAFQSSDYLGLINLDGPSLYPGPTQGPTGPGGTDRMPAVNDVGEPCAGEPHARLYVQPVVMLRTLAGGLGFSLCHAVSAVTRST